MFISGSQGITSVADIIAGFASVVPPPSLQPGMESPAAVDLPKCACADRAEWLPRNRSPEHSVVAAVKTSTLPEVDAG